MLVTTRTKRKRAKPARPAVPKASPSAKASESAKGFHKVTLAESLHAGFELDSIKEAHPDFKTQMDARDAATVAGGKAAPWFDRLLQDSPQILLEARAACVKEILDQVDRGVTTRINTLSLLARAVGVALKRRLLHEALNHTGWNLTATAEHLGLVNAGQVLREIKAVGMGDLLKAARDSGMIVRGSKPGGRKR